MADERIKLLLDMGMSAENARQVVVELDKLKASVKETAGAADELKGSPGTSGRGLMGVSYAFQDFVSVATGGGGIVRALGAISNNIDQVAMAAGASAQKAASLSIAFTGFVAALPLVITAFKGLWDAVSGTEATEEAEKNLKKLQEEIKKTDEALRKLKGTPTEAETAAAKGVKEFLGVRPRAAQAEAALVAAATPEQALEALTAEEQLGFREAGAAAGMTDEQIARQAAMGETEQDRELTRKALEMQRREANARRQALLAQGRRQRAARVIEQAQVAGPGGEEARGALFSATVGKPGFVGIEELTPDAIEARTERRRLTELQNKQAERMATAEAEADKKRRDEANRQAEALNRQAQANESARRDKEARDKEKAARDATRAQEKADRELEREAMGAGVSEKDIRHERATGTAEQLMAQGPQIVGAAFGPQAAARASAAGPADVQAMKQQTIRNLEAGELPYDAILKAFMEVTQAADRQAQAAQRFTGQMNGMVGRLQSSPWPTGLPR